VGDSARECFGVDPVACDLNFVVLALAVHLRVDAVASRACEDLERFLKSLRFKIREVVA